MRQSRKKINYAAIAAAVVVPGVAITVMNQVLPYDGTNQKQAMRAGVGLLLGASLLYFGKSEVTKAAGYGVLGA